MLVPDNLKIGVIKHTRNELVLNKSYQEMAEHYGTAILPTRVRSPKDKATVEGSVDNIFTFILAAIRNQKFFSLKELNEVIHDRRHTFNHKPFQKKDGSRAIWFAEERGPPSCHCRAMHTSWPNGASPPSRSIITSA